MPGGGGPSAGGLGDRGARFHPGGQGLPPPRGGPRVGTSVHGRAPPLSVWTARSMREASLSVTTVMQTTPWCLTASPSGKPGFGFYPYGNPGVGFRPSENPGFVSRPFRNPGFGFRPFRNPGFVPCPSRAVFRPQTDTSRTPVSQMDRKRTRDFTVVPRWTRDEPGIPSEVQTDTQRTRDSAPGPRWTRMEPGSASARRLVRGTTGCADVANAPSVRCGQLCCDAASASGSRFGQHRQRGRRTRFVSWPAPVVAGGAALSFRRPSSLPQASRPRRLPRWPHPHRLPSSVRRWPL